MSRPRESNRNPREPSKSEFGLLVRKLLASAALLGAGWYIPEPMARTKARPTDLGAEPSNSRLSVASAPALNRGLLGIVELRDNNSGTNGLWSVGSNSVKPIHEGSLQFCYRKGTRSVTAIC